MAFILAIPGFLSRWYSIVSPPKPAKASSAIRIGLLGASSIAPIAVITPALSHPEVVIAAVAARDQTRAEAYAKKHSIAKVHTSYDALLADDSIDAVYIPLPNGLHYEWAIKALKAKKHVLLEKPLTSNSEEAKILFDFYESLGHDRPVLLEAFHYRFHPAFNFCKALLDRRVSEGSVVARVEAEAQIPEGFIAKDDIRFVYGLAGGTLMDLGTYTLSCVRGLVGSEPVECTAVTHQPLPAPYAEKEPRIDRATEAELSFPNDVKGRIYCNLLGARSKLLQMKARVEFREEKQGDKTVQRTLRFIGFMVPFTWHKIVEEVVVDGKKSSKTYKAYSWEEAKRQMDDLHIPGSTAPGEVWWSTYRHQMEQFVNRIKQREGNGIWIQPDESIHQMEAIDMIYSKGNLGLRPTSTFRP